VNLLAGRVAIITGASKGIGRVMSRTFAEEGARVACVARSGALVEETAALARRAGGDAIAVIADMSREADAERVVAETVHAFGTVNAIVNNAGDSGPTKPVHEYSIEEWFYTINSSLTSAYLCIRFAVPFMIEAGAGAVVNISSMAGRRGLPFRIGYCSAKAGMIGMTYGLALELGPHDITVNAIAPAAVSGDRIERVVDAQARLRGVPVAEMRQAFVERSPLKRMSSPEDVASLAAFLCSPMARNISGQCIPVTAGEPAS